MGQPAKATRQNRTITVDFQDESTYFQLIHDGKAFVEFALAFILSLGFQLTYKSTCNGGSLTRGWEPAGHIGSTSERSHERIEDVDLLISSSPGSEHRRRSKAKPTL